MEEQHELAGSKLGINCAKYSFLIGTTLFLMHWLFEADILIMLGLFYVICAFIINSLMLVLLLLSLINPSEKRLNILAAIGLMLLNIPIALLYFHFI